MALFNKFFQSSKRKSSSHGESTKRQSFSQNQASNESIFPFSNEQVRVLLFRECDWTGRRLLFDSSAVQKVNIADINQSNTCNSQNEKLPNSNDNDGVNASRAFIEIYNGYGYTYDQKSCESNNIGEMVFGSVAMSFKGTSLKVHWLQEPTRIMCSQVFLSPIYPKNSCCRMSSANDMKRSDSTNRDVSSIQQSADNSVNSFSLSLSLCMTDKLAEMDEKDKAGTTIPLDVPSSLDRSSYAFSGCDSGYSGTDMWTTMSGSSYGYRSDRSSVVSMFSTDPSMVSSRKLSVDSAIIVDAAMNGRSSDGCLQRRILRNMSTSFENNLSGNDFIGYFDESKCERSVSSVPGSMVRRHSDQCESRSNPEMVRRRKNGGKESLKPPHIHFSSYTPKSKATQRRSKIGLAVCIRFSESAEEEMQLFCSEHIALLESMLCRLRAAAETAYLNQKKFHQLMLHAWIATSSWITDLFTAPRIHEPVWFSLSNGYTDRPQHLAKHFMTELCWLLNSADTKDTNFFVSTLLTAILTNHLGWVATVAPIINSAASNDQVITIHQNQAKMSEISKFHPYNVLWAQLGDLYGSIGNPSRLAKTIVCGAQTVTISKVLSVLTYFVRCGEIQRVKSTKEIDKMEIEEMISSKGQRKKVSVPQTNPSMQDQLGIQENRTKGLSRSKTCLKDIATVCHDEPVIPIAKNDTSYEFQIDASNFILATRPELAYSDEAIDVTAMDEKRRHVNNCSTNNTIKLMVTSPNNDRFEYETASEAIDFILKKIEVTANQVESPEQNQHAVIKATTSSKYDDHNGNKSRRLLWSIDTVKEGISIDKWKTFAIDEPDNAHIKNIELKRSHSLKAKPNATNNLRRSKTFREIKRNGTNDYISNLQVENNNKIDSLASLVHEVNFGQNFNKGSPQTLKPTGSVVFVLGDNEVLSGLKTPPPSPTPSAAEKIESHSSSETAPPSTSQRPDEHTESGSTSTRTNGEHSSNDLATTLITAPKSNGSKQEKKKKHCTHKKHSGVKFNFEQYPQIVTNYMKNKNLDITNYDFLEKGLKLEQENTFNYGASSTSLLPMFAPDESQEHDEQEEEEQCECCANTFRILQTPSNATELEFSNDDAVYPVVPAPTTNKPISNQLDTVIEHDSTANDSEQESNATSTIEVDSLRMQQPNEAENGNGKGDNKQENGQCAKKSSNSKALELITLPIPKTEIISDSKNQCRIRPGYVPSLFVGITDHFISDMVLQGITSPPHKWEPILKQNLTLASHCATFEQIPTENVAIIANIDKWDVKLVSSQTYALSSNGFSGPIGMSQLVSTMLETVHAMWLAGTSAYQCMSFLESKLKEIYLQSETLAAFLLATEFCSLNTVTTALNLSANDVPLLLSVASIHSPQVTKKYGISFR